MFPTVLLAVLVQGCTQERNDPVPSTNLAALAEIVDLGFPATSVRYEIFSMPEPGGGIPGPTDYVTLIAELELPGPPPVDPTKHINLPDEEFAVLPRSGRP